MYTVSIHRFTSMLKHTNLLTHKNEMSHGTSPYEEPKNTTRSFLFFFCMGYLKYFCLLLLGIKIVVERQNFVAAANLLPDWKYKNSANALQV